MDNLKLTLMLALVISGCASHVQVSSDYSTEGRFDQYQTFRFLNDRNEANQHHDDIEIAISRRLTSLGFLHDERQADLLISYTIHPDALTIPGFEQTAMSHWAGNDEDKLFEKKPVRLKKGVVHISFFDNASIKTVWQGYASGLKSDAQLKALVFRIMDEYQLVYGQQLALARK